MTQDPEFLNDSDEWSTDSAWENFKEKNKAREKALMEAYKEAFEEKKEIKIEPWIEQGLKDLKPYVDEVKENRKICIYEQALRQIAGKIEISFFTTDIVANMRNMRHIAAKALKEGEEL